MINYDTPDNLIPPELRKRIETALIPHAEAIRERLNTPIPGNPHGGFPGLHFITEHKQTVRQVRNAVIDKWNAENPDHELIVSEPLEAPLTREEIETKLREAKGREAAVHIDHAHAANTDEAIKEHPEEHHEGLREFTRHEANTYGLKPQQYYFRRAAAFEAIKAKGNDPHNLMHRYRHHLESNGQENAEHSDQP